MILYALRCQDCGHEHDVWFENMADYDAQRAGLTCPSCGGGRVAKAIMAPNLGRANAPASLPPCAGGGHACGPGHCPMAMSHG